MDRALEDFMADICKDRRHDKASDSADSAFFELDHSITENGHALATPSLSVLRSFACDVVSKHCSLLAPLNVE